MNTDIFLGTMLRTTVFLGVCAIFAWGILRITRCRSTRIHRLAWTLVILQGVFWTQIPLKFEVEKIEKAAPPKVVSTPIIENVVTPVRMETGVMLPEPIITTIDAKPEIRSIGIVSAPLPIPPKALVSKELREWLAQYGVFLFWLGGIGVIVLTWTFRLVRLLWLVSAGSESRVVLNGVTVTLTNNIGPAVVELPWRSTILIPRSLWEEASEEIKIGRAHV